jgi:hypothetical protein
MRGLVQAGLLRHPGSDELAVLRQRLLYRLVEQHQQLDPFRFILYAGLAGLELPAATAG